MSSGDRPQRICHTMLSTVSSEMVILYQWFILKDIKLFIKEKWSEHLSSYKFTGCRCFKIWSLSFAYNFFFMKQFVKYKISRILDNIRYLLFKNYTRITYTLILCFWSVEKFYLGWNASLSHSFYSLSDLQHNKHRLIAHMWWNVSWLRSYIFVNWKKEKSGLLYMLESYPVVGVLINPYELTGAM